MAPKIMKNKYAVEHTTKELPLARVAEVTAMVEGEARQRDIVKARKLQRRQLARLRRLKRTRAPNFVALVASTKRCLKLQDKIKKRGAEIKVMVKKLDACLEDLEEKTKKRLCEESFAEFLREWAEVKEKRELRKDEKRLHAMVIGNEAEYKVDDEQRGKAGHFVVLAKAVDVKGKIASRLEGSCLFMYE